MTGAGSEAHGAIKERKRTAAMEVRNRFKLTDHEAPLQGGRGAAVCCASSSTLTKC